MEQQAEKKALTLKTLTKSTVWDIQENDRRYYPLGLHD